MRVLAITTSALALACAHETNVPTVSIASPPRIEPARPPECSPMDPAACHWLARRALPTDPRHAFMFESIACEQKLAAACGALGWMMLHGVWGEVDADQAFALLDGACRAHVIESCVDLGVLERNAHHDDAKASAIFSRYCEKNVGRACDELGRMVERGRGFAADVDAATRLFERSCRAGSAAGCGDLGRVSNNHDVLERACRHHDGGACYALGRFERACNLGVADACFAAANTIADGASPTALWWLNRACDEGERHACDSLSARIGLNHKTK